MNIELKKSSWLNKPKKFTITEDSITIVTEPQTDLWQKTYYGFQHDNAPALLFSNDKNFTFTVKTEFSYQKIFDQCGLIIYLDKENWFKASIEFEDKATSKLGSVVTNKGYSDWATQDIETPESIYYRLNRRGPDFLIETSSDGKIFHQLRIFHLALLGKTTKEMGILPASKLQASPVNFGIYACSPVESSFTAKFSEISLGDSLWQYHN